MPISHDMSFLRKPNSEPQIAPPPDGVLPVKLLDTSKRYDLYCNTSGEDRLYENVKLVCIRTLEPQKHQFSTALIGGYIEIEGQDGSLLMIPGMRIYMICEHGKKPVYKLLRVRKSEFEV